MAEKTRAELKEYFNAGDRPTETQFADLIDSFLNRVEDPFIDTIPEASTSQKGIAQQATTGEVSGGVEDTKYVSPKGVKEAVTAFSPVTSVNGQTGSVNITIPTVDDSGWQIPSPLLNGFTNYGSGYQGVRYRKKEGVVYIEGFIQGGSATSVLFVLPAGFRPDARLKFVSIYSLSGSNTVGSIDVLPTGEIRPMQVGTSWVNITGISFPVD